MKIIASSTSKIQARTWGEMVKKLEDKGYFVDSADLDKPNSKYVTVYRSGESYTLEVTRYFDGSYEANLNAVRNDNRDAEELDYWEELASKPVKDSDGFYTDYTLYFNPYRNQYACMFGDKDRYKPGAAYPDYEFDSESEAWEWYDSFDGVEDEDY